jgi:hypothetical protein
MKRSRFSEDRIVGILRENEAGAKAGDRKKRAAWTSDCSIAA